jgi:zinc and cadmium transporter
MQPGLLLAIYCAVIAVVSVLGGLLPALLRLTHKRMQCLMSFLGGVMMGVSVLHLMPHAWAISGSIDTAAAAMLAGLLGMLILIRCCHFHQHETVEDDSLSIVRDHDHDCGHHHDHDSGGHAHVHRPVHSPYSWAGILLGLTIHTMLDGVALAAAVAAESQAGHAVRFAGLGTMLAVMLHKPLDSASLGSLMTISGWRGRAGLIINLAYAAICPVSALVFYTGMQRLPPGGEVVLGWALGVSAGIFLCIALVDIVPEVQFHSHDRVLLSLSLVAGVAVAWLIGMLEPEHGHSGLTPQIRPVCVDCSGRNHPHLSANCRS